MDEQTTKENTADRHSPPESESGLVERLRAGDLDAWALTVQRHNQLLFRIARSILRNDADSEDVVQETYVRAYLRLSEFRGPAGFRTWLVRIARNEALMRLRRDRRMVRAGDPATDDAGESRVPETDAHLAPEAELMRSELARVIEAAVDDLPEEFRPVFVLRQIQQLSTRETAQCLGVPEPTVKTRLHRANRLVRSRIGEELDIAQAAAFEFAGSRCARMGEQVVSRIRALRALR